MSYSVLRRGLLGMVLLALLVGLTQELLAGARATVTLGPIQATAPFSPAWISQMLEPVLPSFARCVQAGPGGYVDLRFDVPAVPVRYRKVPPRVTVENTSIADQALLACVSAVAGSMRFAAAERDSLIRVRLNIEATDGASPQPQPRVAWVQGKLVDAASDQPVSGGTVLILRANVSASALDAAQLAQQVAAMAVSSSAGAFKVSVPPPQGRAYSVAVIANGYEPIAADAAVRGSGTINLGVIRLQRRRF